MTEQSKAAAPVAPVAPITASVHVVKPGSPEEAALDIAANQAKAEAKAKGDLEYGDRILVSGAGADQVNPLTAQRIPHGSPVISQFDRWIEIQVGAKVLVTHEL